MSGAVLQRPVDAENAERSGSGTQKAQSRHRPAADDTAHRRQTRHDAGATYTGHRTNGGHDGGGASSGGGCGGADTPDDAERGVDLAAELLAEHAPGGEVFTVVEDEVVSAIAESAFSPADRLICVE